MRSLSLALLAFGILANTLVASENDAPAQDDVKQGAKCREKKGEATARTVDAVACPLFPIMTYTSGTLYYCDYFDNENCEGEPEAAYVLGNYTYPWTICDIHCLPAEFRGTRFDGLLGPVGLGYSHDPTGMDKLTDAQPAPLAQGFAVNPRVNNVFVRFIHPITSRLAYAKVIEFRVPGGKKYVAFETATPEDGAVTRDATSELKEAISPTSTHARSTYFKADGVKEVPVLILLTS